MVVLVGLPFATRGDDAATLPAGRSRAYADYYHYLPVKERYNADGEREALAHPFENAALDSTVFTSLEPLDALVGGTASIGDVRVLYDYRIDVVDIGYQYGVTDRLTVGLHMPWYRIRNDVRTSFSSANANVGLHPVTGACCIPVAAGGRRLGTEDVQNIVTSRFGYRRIQSWRGEGPGDLELGLKYRHLETDDWALASSAGVRVPTGHADDPDDLTDVAWSFGNYALLYRLHADFVLSNLWNDRQGATSGIGPAPGDLVVNATLRYDHMLPDNPLKRVGDTPAQVFTNNREKVSRKLGDRFDVELSGKYRITKAVRLYGLYRYAFRLRDDVSGSLGFNYASLETDTDSSEHVFVVGASYSTLPAFLEGKFPVPLTASLAFRDRFAGAGPASGQVNPVLRTRWLVVGLSVLF